jgi:hypothetical protein
VTNLKEVKFLGNMNKTKIIKIAGRINDQVGG